VNDRVRTAQRHLGRTIRRARLVEDRALARTVRELGERLAHINHGLLQLVRIHDVSNSAFDSPVGEFQHVLKCLIDLLGPVNLVCVEDHVYVNDIRVRFDLHHDHAQALEKMLTRHNVGGRTYFKELTGDQVRTLLGLFSSEPDPDRPRSALQQQLNGNELSSIELQPVLRFLDAEERVDRSLAEVYNALTGVAAETFANVASGRLPNPLPVRRMLNDMLDVTHGKDLARIAFQVDAKAPAFAQHALMVTNLSVLMARAAGLPDSSLSDLAVSAFLHDIGFCSEGDNHTSAFESHTRSGALALLRQRGFHEARVRRLLVILEHHDPLHDPSTKPSLHARIVHIADDYDTLTRNRDGRGPVWVPADAIRFMAASAGYDPILQQLFINRMGKYPPGSVLRLGDGTMVVSFSGARSSETFDSPRCKVVRMADGNRPQQELWVDLAKGGRIDEVYGSQLYGARPAAEPDPQPQSPPQVAPARPKQTFGNPYLKPPKPPKPQGNGGD
jgi:HD-GYP domain-containing protein (c-di-GMP phosphodiesterase class II)